MKMKKIIILTALMILSSNSVIFGQHLCMKYQKPAAEWTEALPIGNGRLGAMIFGNPNNERIQFNEESLVSGDSVNVGNYQPFGNIFIKSINKPYGNYIRTLSIDSAVMNVSYSKAGIHYSNQYFASYPDHVIISHLKSSKLHGLNIIITLSDEHGATTRYENNRLMYSGALAENGMRYEAQIYAQVSGGKIQHKDSTMIIRNANEITLFIDAGTDFILDRDKHFRGSDPHARITHDIDVAARYSYNQLLERHLQDYQSLYNRVSLTLCKPDNRYTDQIVSDYDKDKGNPYAEELLFQYGRYLMIESSCQGCLPANLQGIWNDQKVPAWRSQYTTDINIEMNYWLTGVTNLPECHEPLFPWLDMMAKVQREKGKTDSKLSTGEHGWICYSTNNIMGGASTWGVNNCGSAWMSQNYWERYAFYGDTALLKRDGYYHLKDLTAFWEQRLITAPDGKHLITPGGWSPEHGPGLKEGDRTLYPGIAYEMQIVYDLFSNYIDAARVLGVDNDYANHISDVRNRLLPPQIGHWGQLQEWMEDWDRQDDHHRHNSHLFAVHPGRQISPFINKQLSDAALVSLRARGDKSTGWSTAWKINIYARLLQGEDAHRQIRSLFSRNILPNLFDSHPPFQIDGNFGYTSGVAEMLLQSNVRQNGKYLYVLLPALPAEWKDGEVDGLLARGGCVVDQKWTNGNLQQATFTATRNTDFIIIYKDIKKELSLKQGQKFVMNM
jgi:alpha-L-fucosidase 2